MGMAVIEVGVMEAEDHRVVVILTEVGVMGVGVVVILTEEGVMGEGVVVLVTEEGVMGVGVVIVTEVGVMGVGVVVIVTEVGVMGEGVVVIVTEVGVMGVGVVVIVTEVGVMEIEDPQVVVMAIRTPAMEDWEAVMEIEDRLIQTHHKSWRKNHKFKKTYKPTHKHLFPLYSEVIREDMEIWAESHMWPFSCYSCQREGRCLPRLTDVSPEELRWKAYQASQDPRAQAAYHEELRSLHEQAMSARRELMSVTPITVQSLVSPKIIATISICTHCVCLTIYSHKFVHKGKVCRTFSHEFKLVQMM